VVLRACPALIWLPVPELRSSLYGKTPDRNLHAVKASNPLNSTDIRESPTSHPHLLIMETPCHPPPSSRSRCRSLHHHSGHRRLPRLHWCARQQELLTSRSVSCRAWATRPHVRHLRVAGNVAPGSDRARRNQRNLHLSSKAAPSVAYRGTEPPPDTFKDDAQLSPSEPTAATASPATQLQAKCPSKHAMSRGHCAREMPRLALPPVAPT
jgi:hypothetical protein